MPTIAVLGATGTLGRRIVGRLASEEGYDLVLLGRDAARLRELAAGAGGPVAATRVVAADADRAELIAATAGVDLVVSAVPAAGGAADRILDAAVASGVDVIDTVDSQPHLLRTYDELDHRARVAGSVVVPGIGWRTAVGDLLVAVAVSRTLDPRQVHVAAVVPDRGGVLGAASPGVLRDLASTLGEPTTALDHGARVEELPGEVRRLAWFPRPFGPHHAAAVAGLETLSVPRHAPEVTTVRSYVALSSARAELLQAIGNLARRQPVRDRVAAALERRASRAPGAGARWAVVAEVAGRELADGVADPVGDGTPGADGTRYTRAWANGHDHLEVSARLVTATAAAVLAGAARPGVRAPAEVGSARDLLDALAAASEVRWSVTDPRGR
ncbi:MAG: saccharopine dehydrogenase NADP-binding domain-containing protein [Nitriliruptor sp.]